MDYDDNDFQGQNLHLAGEGSSKFSPVLRPYALPRFDFDDSHLRFDSLVENEVFLGIPSQEDNQWIEDFSRGSSGIEFSSSAAESCSISRRNNVWSEATSSESVEMLLKSVGLEEMVPGETRVEESDTCDELGCLNRQREPNLRQDDGMKGVIDLVPRSSSELDPKSVSKKCGISVTQKNLRIDKKCDNSNQGEADIMVNECLDNKMQKDPSISEMQIDNVDSSSQDIIASSGELNNQDIPHQVSHVTFKNANGSPKDIDKEVEEHHVVSKEANMNNQDVEGSVVGTITNNLESSICFSSKLESVEGNAVGTSVNNFEEPSSLPAKGHIDLQIAEGCIKAVCSTDTALGSKCIVVDSSKSKEFNQQFNRNMHEESPAIFSNAQDDGMKNNYVEDLSNLTVVSSSNKLLGNKHAIENLEGVNDASGIHKGDSNDACHISPQICEGNLISNQVEVQCVQNISFNEKGNSKLPTDSNNMDCDAVGSLNMDKKVGCLSLGKGIKENDMTVDGLEYDITISNEPALDVSLETTNLASNNTLDGVPSLSGSGATADEVHDHSEKQKLPLLVEGSMHLDRKDESKVEYLTEPSSSTMKECSDGASDLGTVSRVEKGVSSDSALQLQMVDTWNTESQSEDASMATKVVCQEGSKKLEVCLIFCDSTVKEDNDAEAVVAFEKDAVQVPKKDKRLTESIPVSVVKSCADVGQKDHECNATVMASAVNASKQTAHCFEVDTSNDHQGTSGCTHLPESDVNRALEAGCSSEVSNRPKCDSPTIINCTELSQSVKDRQEEVSRSLDKSVPFSEVPDGAADKVQSAPQDLRGNDATKDERSFTFEVNLLKGQSEIETSKAWQSLSTIQACKTLTMVEGSPTSDVGQMDPKIGPEPSRGTPQTADGETSRRGSKGNPERKTRRASGKSTGKENTRKGSHVKETAPTRKSERGDKPSSVSMSPSGISQVVKFEGSRPYGNVERIGTKQSGFIIPTSNLPDLNTSTPPSALYQQPFTDLQQVQLRAQIFVYGSLIQGTMPDEACMISAFGPSDGGRSIWEPAWRACIDRIQGQKSHPNISETPVQSRSGARAGDQAIKQGSLQSKVIPSPVGRASSKDTPSPVVNSIIPLSSPLWNISTPSCGGLQSSGMGRGTLLDYHQTLSPLHPYQTPPPRNFVGHNTWLSQAPFPGAWVASPQTSAIDASSHFSVFPITEAVKLTPVKESSVPISSGTKHASLSPVVHSGSSSGFAGNSSLLDMKKVTVSAVQHSADPKSRKRKKVPVSEDPGQISLLAQTRTESVSIPVISHLSTSVAVTTSACFASKSNTGKIVTAVTPTSSTDHSKRGDQKVMITEESFSKVEEARLQAEDAAAHAAAAVSHSQGVWSKLEKQKNSGLISDVEAKLASAAVTMAAAAAVAKAAAEAAKIASNAALQAKLMADEALVSTGTGNLTQSSSLSPFNVVNNMGKATPTSILNRRDESNSSSSVIIAAREAARRRLEAASAALKHAENLDAIVKAAELAAEAVSQAGKIVAMGDPLPLSELVESGPEGYWKIPKVPSGQGIESTNINREQSNFDRVEEGPIVEGLPDKEKQTTNRGMPTLSIEISRESEDHMRVAEGSEKDIRGQRSRRASDLAKTIGVVPESKIGSRSTSIIDQEEYENSVGTSKDNGIKEGCLVEVFKEVDNIKAAWFSANVLNLKDGEVFVCYTELQSDEGHLKEWVALEGKGNKPPRIRIAHPITTVRFEGTRKRRRAAVGDYSWSVGDRADAWIQDCWREGVVMEKNKKDETTFTVHFPAEGETLVVKAWHLRPTLIWKDGEWIEWSSSREKDHSSQGDTPQEKRLKVGSPPIDSKEKDKMSKNIDIMESRKPEELNVLPLLATEKSFNVGKHSKDVNRPDALRTVRTGLQKEGSKVVFGIPKPGKKRKFMEVSKHYITERMSKNNESNDSVKFAKYLMPRGSGTHRWKNNSKADSKAKQAAESKPKVLRSGKSHTVSGRTIPQKDKFLTSAVSAPSTVMDQIIKDSISNDENNLMEIQSFSNAEGGAEGPILSSSLAFPSDAPSKKTFSSNAKSARMNKGKPAAAGEKLAKIEVKDKAPNGDQENSSPEVMEPRRSNRRIQPTSRLLEGLQSSLIISKVPSASHDKSQKSTNRGTSKGNNHG